MDERKVAATWVAAFCLIWLLAACNRLEVEKSISMESIYPDPTQSQVTVYYTVPEPPPGKVYVLWIVNPALRQAVATGTVPGGSNQSAKATVHFPATGAVISIEDNLSPTTMSTTWALKVGTVTLETPTPGGLPTPTGRSVTPDGTPSAQTTPLAATPVAAPPSATP